MDRPDLIEGIFLLFLRVGFLFDDVVPPFPGSHVEEASEAFVRLVLEGLLDAIGEPSISDEGKVARIPFLALRRHPLEHLHRRQDVVISGLTLFGGEERVDPSTLSCLKRDDWGIC